MKTKVVVALVLVVICGLGLELRLRGIGHLLPTVTQLDASMILNQVRELRERSGDAEVRTQTLYYPQLLARAVSVLPAPPEPESGPPAGVEEHLQRASAPWIQVRIVSAVLSMTLVPLTWLLARRFLGGAWALLAASLVATSLLHMAFSTQERPHGTAAACMLLAVLAAMRLRRRGDAWTFLATGIAAGLAVGALHYGAFVLLPVAGAWLLGFREPRRRGRKLGQVAGLVLALGIVLVLFRFLYPFYFEPNSGLLRLKEVSGERTLNLSGQPLFLERFRGGGFRSMLSNLVSYDPVLLLAGVVGAVLFLARIRTAGWRSLEPTRRGDLLVAFCFLVPYVLVIGMYDESWERFLLALLPYLATCGAFGVRWVVARLAPARIPVPLLAGVPLLLAGIPAMNLAADRAAPDTLRCAAAWIRENVAPEERVVIVPYVDLPLLDGDEALAENAKRPWGSNWTRYQMRLRPEQKLGPRSELYVVPGPRLEAKKAIEADPIGYFKSFGARYAVLIATDNEDLAWWKARDVLLQRGKLVRRFSPAKVDRGEQFGFMQRFVVSPLRLPFFLFVIRSARMGPVLEIFRLD